MYPCSNALYPEKTEVRRSVWLPQVVQAKSSRRRRRIREELGEGVFAREDIVEGTFVLDFGELREASSKEKSVGWKGWSVRLQVETSLSSVSKTFVVKEAHDGRHRRDEVPRGGKVNSTCCRVHLNAELVSDSATMRMYVRTTKLVRTGREILVSFRPDGGFFGGKQGQCRCCWCEKRTPECRA